jgi:hypothetical protein
LVDQAAVLAVTATVTALLGVFQLVIVRTVHVKSMS